MLRLTFLKSMVKLKYWYAGLQAATVESHRTFDIFQIIFWAMANTELSGCFGLMRIGSSCVLVFFKCCVCTHVLNFLFCINELMKFCKRKMFKETTENSNQIFTMVIRALVMSKIRYRGLVSESCAKKLERG